MSILSEKQRDKGKKTERKKYDNERKENKKSVNEYNNVCRGREKRIEMKEGKKIEKEGQSKR